MTTTEKFILVFSACFFILFVYMGYKFFTAPCDWFRNMAMSSVPARCFIQPHSL
jgi:hypothetical protein